MMKSPQVKEQTTSAEEGPKKRKRSAEFDLEGATDTRPPARPLASAPAPVPTPAVPDILPLVKTEALLATPGMQAVSSLIASRQLPGITVSSTVTLEEDGHQAGTPQVGL